MAPGPPAGPLFGQAGPFDYSTEQPMERDRAIAEILWQHQGRARAIAIAELSRRVGGGAREMKRAVERLVMHHALLIGGAREKDGMGGYFIICDEEDFKAAVGPFEAQVRAMEARLERLKRMAIDRGVLRI